MRVTRVTRRGSAAYSRCDRPWCSGHTVAVVHRSVPDGPDVVAPRPLSRANRQTGGCGRGEHTRGFRERRLSATRAGCRPGPPGRDAARARGLGRGDGAGARARPSEGRDIRHGPGPGSCAAKRSQRARSRIAAAGRSTATLSMVSAFGFPSPEPDEPYFNAEEAEALLGAAARQEWWPFEVQMEVSRVWGQALARIAAAEVYNFRFETEPRVRAGEVTPADALATIQRLRRAVAARRSAAGRHPPALGRPRADPVRRPRGRGARPRSDPGGDRRVPAVLRPEGLHPRSPSCTGTRPRRPPRAASPT